MTGGDTVTGSETMTGSDTRTGLAGWVSLRRGAAAAAYFVFGSAYHASGVHGFLSGDSTSGPLWLRLVTLGVACCAVLVLGRAPVVAVAVGVAAGAAALGQGSMGLPLILVLAELLYNGVRYGSRLVSRALMAMVAALTLAVVVTAAIMSHDWRLTFVAAVTVVGILVIPVWWAMEVRQQRELAEAERVRAEQMARIAELDRRAAVSAERSRMARDLHDIVAGQLSAIAIQSEAVLAMADGDPDTVRTVLRSVRENSLASLAEMRAMIDVLRADETEGDVDARTAPPRLRDLTGLIESARAAGVRVEMVMEGLPDGRDDVDAGAGDAAADLPAAVDLTAYRIVQESLTNTVKHAPGSRTRVRVHRGGDRLVVEVVNELTRAASNAGAAATAEGGGDSSAVVSGDGRGFGDEDARGLPDGRSHAEVTARSDTDSGEHVGAGLVSMRERAQIVGGSLSAGRFGNGWRVRAELPTGGVRA